MAASFGAATGSLLLALIGTSLVSAPPAGASGTSWTAYVADDWSNDFTYLDNVQSGSPTVGGSQGIGGGPFGTAITRDGQYAFVSNCSGNSISVVNTTTNSATTVSFVGVKGMNCPSAISVSPDGTQLWVSNYYTINSKFRVDVLCAAAAGCGATAFEGEITQIPAASLSSPIDVAVSPNGEFAYVSNYGGTTVTIICAAAAGCNGTTQYSEMPYSPLTVTTGGATGVDWTAFTPDGNYAYVADCGNVACSTTGNIALIYNPETTSPTVHTVVTTNGYGTNQVDIAPNCSPSSCAMYVTNLTNSSGGRGNVQVYANADSGSFPTLTTTITTGVYSPLYFAVTPDSKYLLVTDAGGYYGTNAQDQIDVISTATDTVGTTLSAGAISAPWTIATQPDPAPTASFNAYPLAAGQSSYFDGSASSSPVGTIAGWNWNFGDGCAATTTGATIEFAYPSSTGGACPSPTMVGAGSVTSYSGTVSGAGGTYSVALTVTNSAGTSTGETYTGHTVSNDGGSTASTTKTLTLPTKLVVTASATAGVQSSTPNIGALTVQMETASGAVVNAPPAGPTATVNLSSSGSGGVFSAYSGSACNSSPTFASTTFATGASSVQVCYGNATSGTYTLTFSSAGLTSVTQSVTVAPPGAYQIAFGTADQSAICMSCGGPTTPNMGPITVATENAAGAAVNAGGSGVTVNLTSSSGTGVFSAWNGTSCNTTPLITSAFIGASSSSVQVCYGDTATGTPTLTLTTTGLTVNTATQVETEAGAATQTVFTSAAESALYVSSATTDMGPITVSLEDASGRVTQATSSLTVTMTSTTPGSGGSRTPYFALYNGTSCATSTPVSSTSGAYTLSTNTSSIQICYGYTKGDTNPVLTATVSGLTAGTQTETVVSGPAYQIVFGSTPVSGAASATPSLGPITIDIEDAGGFFSSVTSNTTVTLSSTSASGTFSVYSGGACSVTDVTSVTILAGTYSTQICYGDTKVGTPTITATTTGLTVNSATQVETVTNAAPAVLVVTTSSQTNVASTTPNEGPITLELQDQFGNPSNAVGSGYTVTLASTSGTGVFSSWTGTACSATTFTSTTIAVGTDSVSICYGDPTAGTPTITATTTGLIVNSVTQSETVNPLAPNKLVISTSARSGGPSLTPNLGPITAVVEDSLGNPAKATSTETITLSSSPSSGAMFSAWTGSACSSSPLITSVTINTGSTSTSICFGDATAASYTITLSGSGMTLSGGSAPTQIETVAAAAWTSNTVSTSQQRSLGGDYFGVSQQPSGTQMVAVGDDSSSFEYGFGHGEVSVASGTSANFNVTRIFDGTQVVPTTMATGVTDTLNSISCPTPSFCGAVDASGNLFTYALSGSTSTWTKVNDGFTSSLNSVSCASSSFCVAVDSAARAFVWGGSSWLETGSPGDTLTSVACATTTACIAADGTSVSYDLYNGSTWTLASSGDTNHLISVSCESASTCAAVDSAGKFLTYTVGTNTWSGTSSTGAASFTSSSALSCAWGSTVCTAFGGSTVYSNVSGSWASSATGKTLVSLSCVEDTSVTTTILCGATDTAGDVLYDDAGSPTGAWTAVAGADSGTEMTAISCVTGALCISGDTAGHALLLLNNGTNYSITTGLATGVGCVQTTDVPAVPLCVVSAVSSTEGAEILVSTDPTDPSSWVASTVPTNASTGYLDGVSCAPGNTLAATMCVVVGYVSGTTENGTVNKGGVLLAATGFTGGGSTTWTDDSSTIGVGNVSGGTVIQLYGVSCITSSECYAAGEGYYPTDSKNEGVTVYYLGSGWAISRYAATGTTGGFTGVVCASTAVCLASGNAGGVATVFSDTSASVATSSWTAANNPSYVTYLYAMGCISTTDCYAAGYTTGGGTLTAGGAVVNETYSGGTWSYTVSENFNFSETIWYGIDCASGLTCTTVGSNYPASPYYPVAATGS